MPDNSPRLDLPYIQPSQAQKHITHNEAVARLDALSQLTVLAVGAETPPATPETGDIHALGNAPTGVWAGQENKLALWDGVAWQFITPREGWRAWDEGAGRLLVAVDGDWIPVVPDLENLEGVGIGTAFDGVNRLAVASEASLFTHSGTSHQVKINKAGTADTASLLFQSGWTGHAEMGLAGDTAFSIKVSPDGSAWHEAMRLDPGAQEIVLAPAGAERAVLSDTGMQIDVPVSGAAVQLSGEDTTPGRLVRVEGAKAAGLSIYGNYYSSSSDIDIDAAQAGEAALYSTATPGTWPANAGGVVWVETQRMYINDSKRQIATQYSGGVLQPPRQWIRVRDRDGTGWTDWAEIFNQASLVGPVGQSGGVPTGAALESGANANGSYVRFADGTQICTHTISLGSVTANGTGVADDPYRTVALDGNWAAGFSAVPHVTVTPLPPEDNFSLAQYLAIGCVRRVTSNSYFDLSAIRPAGQSSASVDFDIQVTATGRWF